MNALDKTLVEVNTAWIAINRNKLSNCESSKSEDYYNYLDTLYGYGNITYHIPFEAYRDILREVRDC